jgi:probable phosphoglycerate mutase
MKLMLVRHGETEENALGIIQGHLPGTLSKNGIEQAKNTALKLKDEHIDYIYSSDLARSANTAKEIVKYHPSITIEFTEKLRERHLGEFQGKKKSDFGWSATDMRATSLDPKHGETKQQLFDRANGLLQYLLQKHKNDVVLLVGHNGINKAIIAAIAGKSHEDLEKVENQKNAVVSIFDINEDLSYTVHVL